MTEEELGANFIWILGVIVGGSCQRSWSLGVPSNAGCRCWAISAALAASPRRSVASVDSQLIGQRGQGLYIGSTPSQCLIDNIMALTRPDAMVRVPPYVRLMGCQADCYGRGIDETHYQKRLGRSQMVECHPSHHTSREGTGYTPYTYAYRYAVVTVSECPLVNGEAALALHCYADSADMDQMQPSDIQVQCREGDSGRRDRNCVTRRSD